MLSKYKFANIYILSPLLFLILLGSNIGCNTLHEERYLFSDECIHWGDFKSCSGRHDINMFEILDYDVHEKYGQLLPQLTKIVDNHVKEHIYENICAYNLHYMIYKKRILVHVSPDINSITGGSWLLCLKVSNWEKKELLLYLVIMEQ